MTEAPQRRSGPDFAAYTSGTHYHQATEETVPERLNLILSRIRAGSRVLEVGCHTGFFSRLLTDHGCRVTGIELNPEASAIAASHAEEVVTGDAGDARLWDALRPDFDVVLFIDVLEHLYDPWTALRNAKRTLAPGGVVLFSLPNVASWTVLRQLIFRRRFCPPETGLYDPTHIRFFTLSEAKELAEQSGYRVVAVHPLWPSIPGAHRLRWPKALGSTWTRAWFRRAPSLAIAVPLIEVVAA